jgi:hypothetical protein
MTFQMQTPPSAAARRGTTRGRLRWGLRFFMTETTSLHADYRESILATIHHSLLKRMEELLGRVPSDDEIKRGSMQITDHSGGSTFYWVYGEHEQQSDCPHHAIQVPTISGPRWLDCAPMARYRPAGFLEGGGWRDALVEEIEIRRVQP